jgi:hypothetical protein
VVKWDNFPEIKGLRPMRITFLLLFLTLLGGLFLWQTFSGALFIVFLLIYLIMLIVTVGYSDTATLFFLGAREVRSSDEAAFYQAASQEAYKLAVPLPRLYFYNGSLDRAFVLQDKQNISLVLNKSLLEVCHVEELSAICFELLLQVKKKMASKRTKIMFLVGLTSWFAHQLSGLFLLLVPSEAFRRSLNLLLTYLLQPWLSLMFKITMGRKYFRRLENFLHDYHDEEALLKQVGLKISVLPQFSSLPSRKMLELSSIEKSRHFQNILSLEFLPHEWDYIFCSEELNRAQQA